MWSRQPLFRRTQRAIQARKAFALIAMECGSRTLLISPYIEPGNRISVTHGRAVRPYVHPGDDGANWLQIPKEKIAGEARGLKKAPTFGNVFNTRNAAYGIADHCSDLARLAQTNNPAGSPRNDLQYAMLTAQRKALISIIWAIWRN